MVLAPKLRFFQASPRTGGNLQQPGWRHYVLRARLCLHNSGQRRRVVSGIIKITVTKNPYTGTHWNCQGFPLSVEVLEADPSLESYQNHVRSKVTEAMMSRAPYGYRCGNIAAISALVPALSNHVGFICITWSWLRAVSFHLWSNARGSLCGRLQYLIVPS